jgi:hypothetical protein
MTATRADIATLVAMSAALLVMSCGGATHDQTARALGSRTSSEVTRPRTAVTDDARRFLRRAATRAARERRHRSPPSVVRFRQVERHAVVYNLGDTHPFALFGTTIRAVRFNRISGARVVDLEGPLRFASADAVVAWSAAGRPHVPQHESHRHTYAIPAAEFSFAAKGAPFTYADVRRLDDSLAGLRAAVRAHVGPSGPLAEARQYAVLLASAPLRPAARAGLVRAMAAIPGVRLCGRRADVAGRRGRAVCIGDRRTEYAFVFDANARLLAVEERMLAPSSQLPTVPPGTVVQRDAFFT